MYSVCNYDEFDFALHVKMTFAIKCMTNLFKTKEY